MSGASFLRLWRVEAWAVFRRRSGRWALALSAALGLLSPLALRGARRLAEDATEQAGVDLRFLVDASLRGAVGGGLLARDFLVLPLLLVLATAASISGERRDGVLRDTLAAPVSRSTVLLAKLAALWTLSAASVAATVAAALAGGLAAFGPAADGLGAALLGALALWASDLGLLALSALVAVHARSVGGVVVGVVLALVADRVARLALGVAGSLGVGWAATAARLLPGSALDAWKGWNGGWDAGALAGLALLVLVAGALAAWRFERIDAG